MTEEPLNPVYKRVAGEWRRCRMSELRIGDEARVECDGETVVGTVASPPELGDNGRWNVNLACEASNPGGT